MSVSLTTVVIDARDPESLAAFWGAVFEWPVTDRSDAGDDLWVEVGPADGSGTSVLVQQVPEERSGKNRVHLDVTPSGGQSEELERLLALGATHADVGQGDETWVVLADPEGNEFCLLRGDGGSASKG